MFTLPSPREEKEVDMGLGVDVHDPDKSAAESCGPLFRILSRRTPLGIVISGDKERKRIVMRRYRTIYWRVSCQYRASAGTRH
jgi:hypothetical protein